MNPSISSLFRRGRRSGQVAVEYGLTILIFMMMILPIIDFYFYFFYKQGMTRILRATARFTVTGLSLEEPAGTINTRNDSIVLAANHYNSTAGIVKITAGDTDTSDGTPAPTDANFFVYPTSTSGSKDVINGGDPGESITLHLTQEFSFLTPAMPLILEGGLKTGYNMESKTLTVNENYSVNVTQSILISEL